MTVVAAVSQRADPDGAEQVMRSAGVFDRAVAHAKADATLGAY